MEKKIEFPQMPARDISICKCNLYHWRFSRLPGSRVSWHSHDERAREREREREGESDKEIRIVCVE